MNCCINCFHDAQIRTMINADGKIGNCDFCESKYIPVYSVESQSDLSDLISEVFNIYEPADDGDPLFSLVINDWGIFEKDLPSTINLVTAFGSVIFGDDGISHNRRVRIPHDYIDQYGIFSGHSWGEFADVIKTKNRFCNNYFKADQFVSFLSYTVTRYTRGTDFYRARISTSKCGFYIDEMGAPPAGKRKPGRVNPEGIGVLYLTSDERTALCEVRASAFDLITVGTFRLTKDIMVVDISRLNGISPMLYSSSLESLAANTKVFSDIAKEIAKPLRRSDSPLEYIPTQYITEFIKSMGYSGVAYESTMGTGGYNVAVFDETLFECIAVHDVEIMKIEYFYDDFTTTE